MKCFLDDCEKKECDAGTVLTIFAMHFCHALTSSPLPSSDIPAFDAYEHGQRSLTRRRGPTSSQELLGQLWAVVIQIVASPCFILLVKFWHRLRALHVHICCFPTVLSGCRGRIAQVLLWFLSLSSSTGKFSAKSLVDSCAIFGSLSCSSSPADSLWFPPHDISTWRSTLPKSSAQDPHAMLSCSRKKNELVREPLADTTFEEPGGT